MTAHTHKLPPPAQASMRGVQAVRCIFLFLWLVCYLSRVCLKRFVDVRSNAHERQKKTNDPSVLISNKRPRRPSWLYYVKTSGTPKVCQLLAGMADKNKSVLYLKNQNNNRAAVQQCSSTYGSKGQRSAAVGTVALPNISGRPLI